MSYRIQSQATLQILMIVLTFWLLQQQKQRPK